MQQLITYFRSSRGLQQSLLVIVGNTFGTALSALALILISRSLGPAQFGEFTVGFAIVMIVTRLNDLGLSAALQRFAASTKDEKKINVFFSLSTKYRLYTSVGILVLGLLAAGPLVKLLHFEQPRIVFFAILFGVMTVYYEQLLAMLQSLHSFTAGVVANALQSGLKLATALCFTLFGLRSPLLLFTSYMLAPLVPILMSRQFLPKWVRLNLTRPFPAERAQLWGMARHLTISLIAAGIVENIDVLFVQGFLNSYEAGLLGGLSRIALLFALVAYSLANVLNPRVARYRQREHLQSYLPKAALISIASLLAFLFFMPFNQLSILITIGPEYMAGGHVLNILVASSFLLLATIPFIALFYVFDAAWYFSFTGIAQLVIIVAGNWLFVPQYGLEAAAWTKLAAKAFLFLFTVVTALWLYRKNDALAPT